MPKLPLPADQPVTVNALRNKRSEIVGMIELHNREAERLRAELIHLDATLRLFDPHTDPEAIDGKLLYPRRTEYFAKGEQTRLIYAYLREHGSASAYEVAEYAIREKNLPPMDALIKRDFVHRFLGQMHDMRRKRKLAKIGKGKGVRWVNLLGVFAR